MQKHADEKTLGIVIPAHRPIERSTLARILEQARLSADDFLALL